MSSLRVSRKRRKHAAAPAPDTSHVNDAPAANSDADSDATAVAVLRQPAPSREDALRDRIDDRCAQLEALRAQQEGAVEADFDKLDVVLVPRCQAMCAGGAPGVLPDSPEDIMYQEVALHTFMAAYASALDNGYCGAEGAARSDL